MLYAKDARILADEKRPKDVTLQELLDETHDAILQAVESWEYSATVTIRDFIPKDVRKGYKHKMKELGYRVSCDWDDWASIIHVRW